MPERSTGDRTYRVEARHEVTLSGGRTVEEWVKACLVPGMSVTVRDAGSREIVFQTDDLEVEP